MALRIQGDATERSGGGHESSLRNPRRARIAGSGGLLGTDGRNGRMETVPCRGIKLSRFTLSALDVDKRGQICWIPKSRNLGVGMHVRLCKARLQVARSKTRCPQPREGAGRKEGIAMLSAMDRMRENRAVRAALAAVLAFAPAARAP